jgi:hypothetical protein
MIRTPPPGMIDTMTFLEKLQEDCYAKHGTEKYILCDNCGLKYKFNLHRMIARLQWIEKNHFQPVDIDG